MENFRESPIVDIKAFDNGEKCPDGFVSIFNYTWPGTIEGCDCLESTKET
jgi:hypothetical protein